MEAVREALNYVLSHGWQEAEVLAAALREVEEWEARHDQTDVLVGFRDAWKARAEAAEAERDRLAEALRPFADVELKETTSFKPGSGSPMSPSSPPPAPPQSAVGAG